MEIKVIKNTEDYKEALKNVELLIEKGVKKGSAEAEKLDVLVALTQDYESKNFIQDTPDPIEAIKFVMEQQGLKQNDLVSYIGSRSKVSEILNGTRPLSLNMIKALHRGLNIPAEVLLNQTPNVNQDEIEFDYNQFPIKEMQKRGYIAQGLNSLDEEIKKFFGSIQFTQKATLPLLARRSHIRSALTKSKDSLLVWAIQVVKRAQGVKGVVEYNSKLLTSEFLHKVVDISDEDDAIIKVVDLLKSIGILLIVEPHMPQTYLDGAAIMIDGKNPIVALTLRHDRLDNFWFTLMHELSHIKLHLGKGDDFFYDDIEDTKPTDSMELEADQLALNTMIPEDKWTDSPASILPSPDAVRILASELSIHPAIVAGKIRYAKKQYHLLNDLIGRGEVAKYFE